jgi:hypothetical protein
MANFFIPCHKLCTSSTLVLLTCHIDLLEFITHYTPYKCRKMGREIRVLYISRMSLLTVIFIAIFIINIFPHSMYYFYILLRYFLKDHNFLIWIKLNVPFFSVVILFCVLLKKILPIFWDGNMVQVVEHLLTKYKALSLNPSTENFFLSAPTS